MNPCTGMPVVLLTTLSKERGLIKGANAVVCRCSEKLITVKTEDGVEHIIPPVTLTYQATSFGRGIEVGRTQLPIMVAFALTVHRLQGQTIHRLLVDLRRPAFVHGMLYVAFGRAVSRHRVWTLLDELNIKPDGIETVNVVIKDLLKYAQFGPDAYDQIVQDLSDGEWTVHVRSYKNEADMDACTTEEEEDWVASDSDMQE